MRVYNLSDIAGRSPCSSYPCPPCPCPSCPCLPCSMSIAHSTFNLNNSADTEVALQELKSSKAHTGRARRPQRKMKLFFQSLAMTNCDSGHRNIWKCGKICRRKSKRTCFWSGNWKLSTGLLFPGSTSDHMTDLSTSVNQTTGLLSIFQSNC